MGKANMSESDRPKERLGEALVRSGAMTEEQVKQVLLRQREQNEIDKLFGEIAVEMQFVDSQTIEDILNQELD
jgi:hypothetical protein